MGPSGIRVLSIAMVVVAGCYDPVALTGVPCSPEGYCPGELTCVDNVCGGDPVVPPTTITGRIGHRIIDVAGTGYAMTEVVIDPQQLTPRAVLDDQSTPTVSYQPDRSFSFESSAVSYRVITNGAKPFDLASAAPEFSAFFPAYGPVGRMPVAASTVLRFDLPADTATGGAFLYVTGMRAVAVVNLGPTVTIDWRAKMISVVNELGLPDAQRGDRLWLVRVAQDQIGKYAYLGSVVAVSATLLDGMTTAVAGTFAALPRNRCLELMTNRAEEVARVTAQYSGSATAVWAIVSTPLAVHGPLGTVVIAFSDTTVANDNLDVHYSNPLPAEDDVAMVQVNVPRTLAAPTGNLDVFLGTIRYAEVTAKPTCAKATVMSDIALPHSPVLGGTSISGDGQNLELDRSAPAKLLIAESSGSVDLYTVVLMEVIPSINTLAPPTLVARRLFISATADFTIDHADLIRDHEYVLYLETRSGYPGAASGDFSTISYPFGRGFNYSGRFRVAN